MVLTAERELFRFLPRRCRRRRWTVPVSAVFASVICGQKNKKTNYT
jgi:hypothetical protein